MIARLSKIIKSHNSLVVIGCAALLVFLANIYFKQILTESEYGYYSILITYIGTIYSLGFLGLEQVLLRLFSVNNRNKVVVPKNVFFLLIIVGVGSSFLTTTIFSFFSPEVPIRAFKILIISLSTIFSMLLYNMLRIRKKFFYSQVIANSWKVILLFVACIFFLNKEYTFVLISDGIFYFSILWIGLLIALLKKSFGIVVSYDIKEVYKFWFNFSIAILTITLLLYVDRYFVQYRLGTIEFGNYFYLATIFLFPFVLFQNYISFKKLVFYKEHFTKARLIKDIFGTIIFGIILAVLVILLSLFLNYLGWINISYNDNLLFLIAFSTLGIIRLVYAIVSSAVGTQIELKEFKKINIISLVSLIILLIVMFIIGTSKESILFIISLMWLARATTYTFYLLRIEDKRYSKSV